MLEKDFENAYTSYQESQIPNEELIHKTLCKIEKKQKSPAVIKPILRFSCVSTCLILLVATFITANFIGKGDVEQYEVPPDQTPPTIMANSSQSNDSASEENVALNEASSAPFNTVSENNKNTQISSDQTTYYLNTVIGQMSYALPMISGETHRIEYLTKEEVLSYFGRTIDPILPEGLTPAPETEDQKWEFIYLRETNEIFYDACAFVYADKFDQEGLPTADAKTLNIAVSKKGYHFGIYYAEENPRAINSYGVEITFGQVKDKPIYSAEFKIDGIQYTVMGHGLTLTDLNCVVKSLVS